MQKKNKACILAIVMMVIMLLSGCLGRRDPSTDNSDDQNSAGDVATISGIIIKITENSMLIQEKKEANEFCGLYDIGIKDVPITSAQNDTKSTTDLATGMLVNIYYDGQILETYPGQINGSRIEVVEQTGDLIGMYLSVIKELYEEDPGLNGEIKTIVLDLTQVSNLTQDQKDALMYLVDCEFDYEVRTGTIQELQEEGLIQDLYYEDGVVFIISDNASNNNKFGFKAQKWRSGLGAIGYDNCKATKKDGIWEYELSGAWIS